MPNRRDFLKAAGAATAAMTMNASSYAQVQGANERIGVGLLLTFVVTLAAWWTAGMNTQSSTGLLYVGLGCVIAGEISARVIFFLTGVPV